MSRRHKMRRGFFKKLTATVISAVLLAGSSVWAVGPQTRGPISLQLTSDNVTVTVGESAQIKATLSPDMEEELIGCGCGGTCGEDTCKDPSQGCICYGTDGAKQSYYADVSVVNPKSAIASAAYNDGYIKITGLSVGTVTVTAVGTLRKYGNASVPISITVKKAQSGTASTGSSGPSAAGATSASATSTPSGVSAAAVSPTTGGTVSSGSASASSAATSSSSPASSASAASSSASAASPAESAVTSGSADVSTVELVSGKTGKTALLDIQGQNKSVVFEKKDGDKLLYFWTFNGENVTAPADFDMGITTSTYNNTLRQALDIQGDALYLNFAHSGTLPGKATVSVNAGDAFADGTALYTYYYNATDKKAELIQKATVKDGFVSFDISHCSQYFFTSAPLSTSATQTAKATGAAVPVIPLAVALAVVVAALFCYLFFWARRGGTPAALAQKLFGRFGKKRARV